MRLTRAEVDLKCLRDNYEGVRQRIGPNVKIMGVVKANAYGHGIVRVAQSLVSFGVEYLGVGFIEEAIELRRHGVWVPILVLGGVLGTQVREFIQHDVEIAISSLEIAERVEAQAEVLEKKAKVHLKIDTGMGRIGVHSSNAPKLIERVLSFKHLEVVGVYSHLGTADEKDKAFAIEQLDRFQSVLQKTREMGFEVPLAHIANSGAILDLPDSYFSMVRPGIMLYGVYPSKETTETIPLKPVLSLKTSVVFIKEVPASTGISYGRRYVTSQRTKIATLPMGYGDGYSRTLSNRAEVIIRGQRYPVIGTVCMDQTMVDVGPDADIHVGDDAILIGGEGSSNVSAWEVSEWQGTIPYEVLTAIATRVPRVYVQ